jgi:hypothetical protein
MRVPRVNGASGSLPPGTMACPRRVASADRKKEDAKRHATRNRLDGPGYAPS